MNIIFEKIELTEKWKFSFVKVVVCIMSIVSISI